MDSSPYTYLTPRGQMKLAAGSRFELGYKFRGIAPTLPAPHTNGLTNDYVANRMANYLASFAQGHPTDGADTYWAGKEMAITAQYLSFARQLGMTNEVAQLTSGLRSLMTNWLTYTPGESQRCFASYDNWRALVGFSAGYGSEAFNDNHFHYGYFAVAAALLGMEDSSFASQFGPMATLVAKQYANWDRSDMRFPLFRTFDIWEGHSWAGGFSAGGGGNQESSSEAMNSWTGLFLLGSVLGNDEMTAAGAMGYAVESAAVNEYWQDTSRTNLPASYGKGMVGILWAGGLSYGTYFSGDPAWIHGIQWVPASHWNSYLVRDKAYANWQLTNLWTERVVASQHGLSGFTLTDANHAPALGGYLGNYVLGFQTLFDADGVAAILDNAYATNAAIASDATYSGITYYLTHSLRALGDEDPDCYTSIPTSRVYYNPRSGRRTALIYNPANLSRPATLYSNGTPVEVVAAPARVLTVRAFGQTNALRAAIQTGRRITWMGTNNTLFQVQRNSGGGGGWTNLAPPIPGNGATNEWFDPGDLSVEWNYRVLATTGTATNILVNGGFESGTGTTAANWSMGGSQIPMRNGADTHSGSFAMRLIVTNAAATPNSASISQNIGSQGGLPVVPGQAYDFSFWARQISSGPSYVQNYRVAWLAAGGATVADTGWTGFTGGAGSWKLISRTNLVAPSNAVNAIIEMYGTTGAVPNGYGEVIVDDVSLSPPPLVQTNLAAAIVADASKISWNSENGKYYLIQWANSLAVYQWNDLPGPILGSGGTCAALDLINSTTARLYRVRETQ